MVNSIFDLLSKTHSRNLVLKRTVWFLFKVFVLYFAFNLFFLLYTGLTILGGKFDSPFLAERANFINVFRRFLLWGGARFATMMGHPAGYNDYLLYVYGGSKERMVYSCLGLSLMSASAALILALAAKGLHRIISLVIGMVIIVVLNMIRLGGLAVLYTTGNYGLFKYINHHDLFNIIMLAVVLIMFVSQMNYSDIKYRDKKLTA